MFACDAGKLQGLELQNEEVVFAMLAQVVVRREADGHGPGQQQITTQTAFCADKLSAHLSHLSTETYLAATQMLRETRQALLDKCRGAGLELNEKKLGFVGAPVQWKANVSKAARMPSGWLELLQAAAEAGAVRLVEIGGVWHATRGECVSAQGAGLFESWSPQVFDVSLKFAVDLHSMPMEKGVRVSEDQLVFQVILQPEAHPPLNPKP